MEALKEELSKELANNVIPASLYNKINDLCMLSLEHHCKLSNLRAWADSAMRSAGDDALISAKTLKELLDR